MDLFWPTPSSTPSGDRRGPPFILLSSPRCGSTTLIECLGMHPGLEVLSEPFHPLSGFARTFSAESDVPPREDPGARVAAFEDAVEAIFARWDGIKHMLHQLRPLLGRRLLRRPRTKVIFLGRANRLQQAVSNLLAFETGVWHAGDGSWPPTTLPAMPTEGIAATMAYYRRSEHVYRAILRRHQVDCIELLYEDLFRARSWPRQRAVLDRLFAFLGRPRLEDRALLDRQRAALDPSHHRLNSATTYRRIPNHREIDRRLGSPTDGYLLPIRKTIGPRRAGMTCDST